MSFSVGAVEATVSAALAVDSGIAGVSNARQAYESNLFDWVDEITEGGGEGGAREAVADLWLSYAKMETEKRQFKAATKVLESATACPVAAGFPKVWLAYAAFWTARGKASKAEKVYHRALGAVAAPPEARATLFEHYHAFLRGHGQPALTLEELQERWAASN
eukprot:CAMPEP_0119506164 /NCGR_PEP_ID=MMETSP1344-20130328/26485_1 /TAXON_ID=236787 /ORGANISM="Florenciella parvula, Strain CCMP2471" /LENGTH=162 /DNA_ID=CAMNT_0007542683 /DNA_START=169 /DNA_END=654 /DNA_ORIENTATION=-